MPRRVKLTMLLGLVVVLVLSVGITAGAQLDAPPVLDPILGETPPQGASLPQDGVPLPQDGVPLPQQGGDPMMGGMPPADAIPPAGGAPNDAAPRRGGGGGGSALGIAEAQMGKPFAMATDGPGTFSCVGLMRFALREAGIDPDAPWVPEEYLSRYKPVAPGDLQPGDIVIYPGWATMYAGNGQLINANELEGLVTHTPMDVAGEPLGIVRP